MHLKSLTLLFLSGLFLSGLLATTPVFADGVVDKLMTPADKAKLESYRQARAEALATARAGGSAADLAELDRALSGEPLSFRDGFDPRGDWRCRVIGLGGGLPIVVYGWFACRVSDDGAGWRLQKLTGSQRTNGLFYDDGDKRQIYLGALTYGYEPKPVAYGADRQRNQVAYAFRAGARKMRLEFPSPEFSSAMEILEMERR